MYSFFSQQIRKYQIKSTFTHPYQFLRIGFSWVINKFSSLYHIVFPKPAPKITTETKDALTVYLETKKKNFLRTYEESYPNEHVNSSIDKCFYSKEELFDSIMDKDNMLEKDWRSRILFESTPRGNIIMYYHVFKQGFSYYSDVNNIPYSILNAVAMKYVLVFNCRDFFIDNQVTPAAEPSPFIKIYVDEPKKVNEVKTATKAPAIPTNLLVKYKNYNKNKDTATKKSPTVKEGDVTPVSNAFINQGKINNFSVIQKPKKVYAMNNFQSTFTPIFNSETTLQKTVMSYKDFKAGREPKEPSGN